MFHLLEHIWQTDFLHWWQAYFVPAHEPWYRAGVWGNVFAVIPLAPLGAIGAWLGYVWHQGVVGDLRREVERHKLNHSKLLEHVVDALDPGDGDDLHAKLNSILDALDPNTPGGIREVIEEIRKAG